MIGSMPPLVAGYLQETLIQAADPLLLSFAPDWTLTGAAGDATRFGAQPAQLAAQLRDVFIGMPLDELQVLPYMDLGHGRRAHLHLLPDKGGFHVVLLDAEGEAAQRQKVQQLGNQAQLASQEKTKALRSLKRAHATVEAQRDSLEEAGALKDALIATLSHEFRTPLTAIFGYIHLLEKGRFDEQTRAAPLRSLRRATTHLYALAENLLEYARAPQGGSIVTPQALAPHELVDDLRGIFAPIAESAGLGFEVGVSVEEGARFVTDPVKLRQVLINLVSNGIRYTQRGRVRVQLAVTRHELVATVEDTGIGIPAEFRPKLFKAFERADARVRGGAGLGLAITRRLVDQLGGTIAVESETGRGTQFRVVLPSLARLVSAAESAAQREAARAAAVEAAPPRGNGRALVADDDPDLREILRGLLAELGYEVHLAGNANDAYEGVYAHSPSLLVIDLQMPGLPGSATVFRLRAEGYHGRIVMLSATPTEDAREAARKSGADRFLTKPIDVEAFAAACRD